jgi:NAD(P)-dependent dehydrogenase (short-subunit alcohol dehydrogenase family)
VAERAALVTGGSSGIGLAIARMLGEEGYGVTVSSRRPEKLAAAAEELRSGGLDVHSVAANMTDEEQVVEVIRSHRERFGRLDVLVNNAGVGIGQPMEEIATKYLDMQLGVNLRAVIIGTREALPMLREAGAEHRKALIINMASIAGKSEAGGAARSAEVEASPPPPQPAVVVPSAIEPARTSVPSRARPGSSTRAS